jgi:hypothetical protein
MPAPEIIKKYTPSFHAIPLNSKGEPDKKIWYDLRNEIGIGASENDAVIGRHKYTKPEQIMDRKLGIKEVFSKDAIKRMANGNIREEEIMTLYRERTGLQVETLSIKDKIYYNPDNPFLFSSLDGLVTRKDGSQYVIDAKLSNAYFWKENDPGYYYGQAQQQLYCMGLDYHEFVVLSPDIPPGEGKPEDLKIIPVKRSENYIRDMIIICGEFWNEVLKKRAEMNV